MDARLQRAMDAMDLMVLEDGRRWGESAVAYQRANAAAILDQRSPVRQHWVELPRGARKTTDLAGILLVVLLTQAPAMARIYVGASDADQAAELIDAAEGLIIRTPELAGRFKVNDLEITNTSNGAAVIALAADASAMGKRAYMIVLDEVANWPETRKARKFWTALVSGNRKINDCRTVVISNCGDPQSWTWKRRETARTSDAWRFFTMPGPLPWLTETDLRILRENSEVESEYERLHLNRWVAAEDRLATPEDLRACTVLTGPLPPRPGTHYVVTLDIGVVNDRTAIAVMHAEKDNTGSRKVVVDAIRTWHGTRRTPVDLQAVADTVAELSVRYNRANVLADPHQALMIGQQLRGRGVAVDEFVFSASSVGKLALALHQAIRQHRIDLPDDADLLEELGAVRLRKNSLGVYRLDHDAAGHDDQAVALALGCHHLMDQDNAAGFHFGSVVVNPAHDPFASAGPAPAPPQTIGGHSTLTAGGRVRGWPDDFYPGGTSPWAL